MVNYEAKLGIDFELSPKQIEILDRDKDTIVRALPGSGKTTILTLKVKNILLNSPRINKVCCISYTNVNVEDLEINCSKIIRPELLDNVEFLTFHSFCLQYVLYPFSYLYMSSKGLRPYRTIFNFKEHGDVLIEYLKKHNVEDSEISKILSDEKVYYNFKFINGVWKSINNNCKVTTINGYLNFLRIYKLIDFNLINLLALFIIQENYVVRRALNKSMDWILIDEFQDVSEIQCKIIKELSSNRVNQKLETRWFMVGDPNQSIYGFAGANPRSMYDMRIFFNNLHQNEDCEIKLEKTHRCSDKVFEFARQNYNKVLSRIRNSQSIKNLQNQEIYDYINDLEISKNLQANGDNGRVIIIPTISAVSTILDLKFKELLNEEVCCIGINKFHSIDVYKQYKLQDSSDKSEDFSLYSEIYKDYEENYGSKYFSLFVRYLILKYHFYNNRLKYPKSLEKFIYSLRILISEKLNENASLEILTGIAVDSIDLLSPLEPDKNIFNEFISFAKKFVSSLTINLELNDSEKSIFSPLSDEDKINSLTGITEPKILDFLHFITKSNTEKLLFEIKHINKIKGLEYEQVIVQRIEDLPHRTKNRMHGAVFFGNNYQISVDEIYDYIQELNKLYVMLTRTKKNLYIIKNQNKNCLFIEIYQ